MNSLLNYLLEVNISLVLFMLVYVLLLRGETQFSFNRIYLMLSLVASFVFPFFHFRVPVSNELVPSANNLMPSYLLNELRVNGDEINVAQAANEITPLVVVEWVYAIILVTLMTIFLYRIARIIQLFGNNFTYRWRNYIVSETNDPKPTFSFFHFILIGQANKLSPNEKEDILIHESAHIQRLHSLDILLVNLAGIVCWFNPIVHFYKRTLVQLHEFEADAFAVSGKDTHAYCGLLAKVALHSAGFPLGNHFNSSLTTKRIQMMNTVKTKMTNWKTVMLVILVPIFFFAIACQDQLHNNTQQSLSIETLPKDIQQQTRTFAKYNDQVRVLEINDANKKELEELGYYDGQPKNALRVISGGFIKDQFSYVITGKPKSFLKNESQVFSVVDEMATPVFGFDALYENLGHIIQYPEQARKNGVEGKVYIEFVVQTDGTLSDIKLIRGVDDDIDTEALRAFYQLQAKWNPAIHHGQLVKMRMTMPIVFSLKNRSHASREPNAVEQMEVAFGTNRSLKPHANGKLMIEGVVYSNDGTPFPGVKVEIKGSNEGGYSDSDGKFIFETSQEKGVAHFSFEGFKALDVSFGIN
ncbi:MAG: TonB family protein [Bacteroidetes bacterium]|nr:TonB family protein [Bacteroidota bacterium]